MKDLVEICHRAYHDIEGWLHDLGEWAGGLVEGISFDDWNTGDWLLAIVTVFSFAFLIWQVLRTEAMLPVQNFNIGTGAVPGQNVPDIFQEGIVTVRPNADFTMQVAELRPIDGCVKIKDEAHTGYSAYVSRTEGQVSLHIRQTAGKARLVLVWRRPAKLTGRPVAEARRITVDFHVRPVPIEHEIWKWKRFAWAIHLANTLFRRQWSEGSWIPSSEYWKSSLPENAVRYPRRRKRTDGKPNQSAHTHGPNTLYL